MFYSNGLFILFFIIRPAHVSPFCVTHTQSITYGHTVDNYFFYELYFANAEKLDLRPH
jgi:hypothetical protein